MSWLRLALILAVVVLALAAPGDLLAADDPCLACHSGGALGEPRLDVDAQRFAASVHGKADFSCTDCHASLAGIEEFPHGDVAPVDCATCHDAEPGLVAGSVHGGSGAASGAPGVSCAACHRPHEIGVEPPACESCHVEVGKHYARSLHGQEVRKGATLAPRCWTCHGSHEIRRVDDPESRVARPQIPFLCGSCHKEGSPVTETYDIPQESILEHYSESIHGEGLLKRGLTVSAVCSDCHTSHDTLPHTDPRSSIHRDNVAKTCQKCHGQIEQVHRKVIRGELWEKEPHRVPACVDCHQPHRVRNVYYEQGLADTQCLKCHSNPDLETRREGKVVSLHVDAEEVHGSIHRNTRCAQCHTGADPLAAERPCATIRTRVDCSTCHAEVAQTYAASVHGGLVERGDPNAPRCTDCHGVHGVKGHQDPASPTYPSQIPALCGGCHRTGEKAALRYQGDDVQVVEHYVESIHGKGLLQSGLVVTATCTDCHTAHHMLPKKDPQSSVNPANIPATCARCHNGIYEKFARSIHSPLVSKSTERLPTCFDCHNSHEIVRADSEGFKLGIMNQCGECHADVTETYFDTFHGKASKLGGTSTAKCFDCHGAHDILPPSDPASHLSRKNIVQTCAQCHDGAHLRFAAGYLTHATHHDRRKYPWLFYSFWFMTSLLVGTLTVAGAHTLLWLPRSWQMMKVRRRQEAEIHGKVYRRFPKLYRQLHIMVIVSFLGLAITGMTLKFSYLGWAQGISGVLGGFESAGYIHRVCAVITFAYFGIHAWDLFRKKRASGLSWFRYLMHPGSMIPNRKDLADLIATFKWFVGRGPRPAYGRWTYWEKFDYFAVFWGVAIIGTTGLMLWFPEWFTYLLPGWIINVATIIHSDEALLAVAFIFTVHFFNTHFRPDRFPMDTVIFTGRVPVDELRDDRPLEYEQLVRSGELEKLLVDPLPPYVESGFRVFGWIALSVGLALVLLILWAELFGYR